MDEYDWYLYSWTWCGDPDMGVLEIFTYSSALTSDVIDNYYLLYLLLFQFI